ncbi:hypothetical protein B0H17DRAFT_1197140 [Mycena rosella]|uniref:Uncharacterized protein n=1 Tax=Mycena rosella TaxID=1033263 RepID=A0AAD7DR37_MYCRO|nr:hypothetical protein B0H17DRAFT_1197140 [Mycena rosella]
MKSKAKDTSTLRKKKDKAPPSPTRTSTRPHVQTSRAKESAEQALEDSDAEMSVVPTPADDASEKDVTASSIGWKPRQKLFSDSKESAEEGKKKTSSPLTMMPGFVMRSEPVMDPEIVEECST